MMGRKIKFRGYDIDTKKWYYGGYVKFNKVTLCMATEQEVKENEEHFILFQGFSDWNLPAPRHMATVVYESVGQYTGLKDKNGVEIYEGDIVKSYKHGDKETPAVTNSVSFRNGTYFYGNYTWIEFLNRFRYLEVVGNIYQNSELLGGNI